MTDYNSLQVLRFLFVIWCSFGFAVMTTWFIARYIADNFPFFGNMQDFLQQVNRFIKNTYVPLAVALTLIFSAANLIFGQVVK